MRHSSFRCTRKATSNCSNKAAWLRCAPPNGSGMTCSTMPSLYRSCAVSFIISQRKSIPAIRRAVELLSERFGERLGSDSEGPVYAFPTAEALCCAGEQALQECGLGYRTRYVLHAAQQAAEGTLDLKKLASLPDEALFARLMELDGVGKKVANCVCLFGYGRVGRVPVDVWIERLIRDEFAGQDPFPQFGLEAGIVQQYLFFYKRSVG